VEQAEPDSVSNSIILRDGHCHNHGRLPARDPIYLAWTLGRSCARPRPTTSRKCGNQRQILATPQA
jgi:hypothetical protein